MARHLPSHLEILLVPKTLLQRSTNRLGTVERDIRTTRHFPTNTEVQPIDYLMRIFSGLPRRTRRPRGRPETYLQRLEFAGSPRAGWHTSTRARPRQAASAHHESSSALLASPLEGDRTITLWLLLGGIIARVMAKFGDSRSSSVAYRARHLVGRTEW